MSTIARSAVRVRLGHAFHAPTGRSLLELELDDGATARDLTEAIGRRAPHLELLLQLALVVAAGRILRPDEEIPRDEEVALLLPAAGG